MTPARVLAPAALVAAAIALFAILVSGGGSEPEQQASPQPAATATATATPTPRPEREDAKPEPSGETYTVQPGDTPTAIAEQEGVDVDELLALNPDIDPAGLTVGEELELP